MAGVSSRTELRKRRQHRRRDVFVGFVAVLLVVAAAGIFVATLGGASDQAAPNSRTPVVIT